MSELASTYIRALTSDLRSYIGSECVVDDPDITVGYATDATTWRFTNHVPLVVRPRTAGQVARVLKYLASCGVPVVPQAGNTGVVQGGIPRRSDQVVLSTAGFTGVRELPGQLIVGAGVTQTRLHELAKAQGMAYGVSFGASNAMVGGMIATNARGSLAYRYGDTAAQVLGLEAVSATGYVDSTLEGGHAGIDWLQLLPGSEGTLGIVTAARLRLIAAHPKRTTALLGVPSLEAAVEVIELLKDEPFIEALEVMLGEGMEFVCRELKLPPPFSQPAPVYLLAEAVGEEDPTQQLGLALAALPDGHIASDALAEGEPRKRLWRYREGFPEACNRRDPVKLDVAVPLGEYAGFMSVLPEVIRQVEPDAVVVLFSHGAVGGAHVNVLGASDAKAVTNAVLTLVLKLGGNIAAEHGFGTAKASWLNRALPASTVAQMWAIKNALDPAGILNPGVVLPD